jgi:hypothetical protein
MREACGEVTSVFVTLIVLTSHSILNIYHESVVMLLMRGPEILTDVAAVA